MYKLDSWKVIIERFQKRLTSWKAKNLSMGGRLTLIKSVLGNLPTYFLSIFRAPIGVVDILERIRRRFFWGFKEDTKGVSWIKWSDILSSKDQGGLGIGSIRAKNLSLIGKWHWRFLNEGEAPWCKVVKAIYGSDGVGVWKKTFAWWQIPWRSPSISIKDMVVDSKTFLNNKWKNKIFHGVCLVAMWAIWRWRNNIVHAYAEDRPKIRDVDVFPSIQSLSLLWISNRCPRIEFDWSRWVSSPGASFESASGLYFLS
ncbi:hypothetical protein CTI12_AA290670 [Artemisia annua]|uniref:RNA-directed DNA polymerase, eukaryota, Reverse transcriptase zinc-binding domain protein n=1 Tax=Artemisia annua TaxID=35608 RepID=A0A2U1N9N7_ARTAN|nr:hypothetical protein CTI12_AA290670 [Artemisia annua]